VIDTGRYIVGYVVQKESQVLGQELNPQLGSFSCANGFAVSKKEAAPLLRESLSDLTWLSA